MDPASEVEVRHHSAACTIATWDRVLISIWRDNVEETLMKQAVGELKTLRELHPEGVASFAVLDRGLSLPSASVRRSLPAIVKASENLLTCRAVVLEGQGFWASAFRSLITGISYMAGRSSCVASDREEAVVHLSRYMHGSSTWRSQLLKTLAELEKLPKA